MDPLYCLICCGDVVKATGRVIKQEVVDLDVDIHLNSEVEERHLGGTLPLLVVQTEEEKRNVSQTFCKLFNVKSSKKGMWSSGRGDQPFCGECSSQLLKLFKLQKKVKEVEKVIKGNLEAAEDQFERNNVYQTDKRYGQIRQGILAGKKGVKQSKKVTKNVDKSQKKKRLCARTAEKSDDDFSAHTPTTSSHSRSKSTKNTSHRSSKPVSKRGVSAAEGGDSVVLLSKRNECKDELDKELLISLNVLEDDDREGLYEDESSDDNSWVKHRRVNMPKKAKRQAPPGTGEKLKLVKDQEDFPQAKKTMADLPPEVVTIILGHLTRTDKRSNSLIYCLVNSQWRDIIRCCLEKRIISGDSPVFPRMKLHCLSQRVDLLHVSHSPTMLPAGRNPFPSNSLILDGWTGKTDLNYFPKSLADIERVTVPDFMLKFGGYLTSFELQDVILPGINSMLTLLNSLSSLKALIVQNVDFCDRMIKRLDSLPVPPRLPNLTTLVVKSNISFDKKSMYEPGRLDEVRYIVPLWLITWYSDQLLHLGLQTYEPLPALQRRMQYYYSFPNGKRLSIATTSDTAFQNLKQLQTKRPNKNFLCLSDVPKIQRLTVTDLPLCYPIEMGLQDITDFISSKFRNTLKNLCLDVEWERLMTREATFRLCFEGILPPPLTESRFPNIKTLAIQFAMTFDQTEDILISTFLELFPTLENFHFLRFPDYYTATANELKIINKTGRLDKSGIKVAAAKTKLASFQQGLFEQTKSFHQQSSANSAISWYERKKQLDLKVRCAKKTAKRASTEIFEELATLGVKRQNAVVEQFLERQGIWEKFANLKIVSASSREKPDGDICFIKRPESP